MNVYLAGPMSDVPFFNVPAFLTAGVALRAAGHVVFNPAEADIERAGDFYTRCPQGTRAELEAADVPQINYRDCLRLDLNYILDHADAIALLPGWERSKGVAAELATARALGLKEIYL